MSHTAETDKAPAMAIKLNAAQEAAVRLRGRSVLVSAAAGAGKTRVLVERLLAYVLEDGRQVDEFLLITFTRAAAGEMRARIYKRLRELERTQPRDGRIREQLRRLPAARICTLDAYCQELVAENAALLGLPSVFHIADEARMEALRERVMEETLDSLYEENADKPGSSFSCMAEAYGDARGDGALGRMALELWEKTRAQPAPLLWLEAQLARLQEPDGAWAALLLDSDRNRLAHLCGLYGEILPDLQNGGYERSYVLTHGEDLRLLDGLSEALEAGWDEAVIFLGAAKKERLRSARVKKGEEPPDPEAGEAFKELRDKLEAVLKKLRERYALPLAEGFAVLREAREQLRALPELLRRFDEALWQEKLRLGCLDFADIRFKALELLRPGGEPGVMAALYGARFHEIMVDEYQDINALQNLIIDTLSRQGENIFYVGDMRQSIYRFQLAEPALFQSKYKAFRPYTEEDLAGKTPGEPVRVVLRENYRSSPVILEAVNRLFTRVDCPEMGVLPPESLLRSGGGAEADREAVEWLPAGDNEEETVAARLRALCDSGAARPSDCVILLRALTAKLPAYRKALEAQGLGCVAVGGEQYLDRPEILQLRAALRVVRNARDDTAMVALLRGPLLSLDADGLAALRALGDGAFCDCVNASAEPRLVRFRETLRRWRDLAADLPPYELCSQILADTRLPGQYNGAARENLLLFPELLRDYQGQDLQGLEDWLARKERSKAAPPRRGASDTGAVRLMTIHKSKGLEFPVVVVAGLSRQWNTKDQTNRLLFHPHLGLGVRCQEELCHYPTPAYHAVAEGLRSEARSEELRLLYVAMTRAEHKLILAGAEEAKPLTRSGFVSKGAFLDAPDMASWLVTVRDPSWAEPPLPIAAAEEKQESAQTAEKPSMSAKPFVYPHREAAATPAKMTATGIKERLNPPDSPASQERETASAPKASRPIPLRAPRFDGHTPPLSPAQKGTALHKFMQFARYEHCVTAEGAAAERNRLEALALLPSPEAGVVDPALVAAFFQGETGKRLLDSPGLRREQRFSLLVRDGDIPLLRLPAGECALLQGVIDCYFPRPDGKLCLLDFKTDVVWEGTLPERIREHTPQLQIYAAALERITGRPVAEKLLCFLTAGLCAAL